jgi:hypothetical protein
MSALGQKRTLRLVRLMSALPPKADIRRRGVNVRFVPKADIPGCCGRKKKPPSVAGGFVSERNLTRQWNW